jgi:hypothetical protein
MKVPGLFVLEVGEVGNPNIKNGCGAQMVSEMH